MGEPPSPPPPVATTLQVEVRSCQSLHLTPSPSLRTASLHLEMGEPQSPPPSMMTPLLEVRSRPGPALFPTIERDFTPVGDGETAISPSSGGNPTPGGGEELPVRPYTLHHLPLFERPYSTWRWGKPPSPPPLVVTPLQVEVRSCQSLHLTPSPSLRVASLHLEMGEPQSPPPLMITPLLEVRSWPGQVSLPAPSQCVTA